MEYVVETQAAKKIDWAATGVNRILQNVRNLMNTWRYEVAYNRTMGIDPGIIDKPSDVAEALFISDFFRIVPIYEPRAAVKEVRLIETDEEGNMSFKVVVEIE